MAQCEHGRGAGIYHPSPWIFEREVKFEEKVDIHEILRI
jgi:hypothetical protein